MNFWAFFNAKLFDAFLKNGRIINLIVKLDHLLYLPFKQQDA
jgi:hypothetical protein